MKPCACLYEIQYIEYISITSISIWEWYSAALGMSFSGDVMSNDVVDPPWHRGAGGSRWEWRGHLGGAGEPSSLRRVTTKSSQPPSQLQNGRSVCRVHVRACVSVRVHRCAPVCICACVYLCMCTHCLYSRWTKQFGTNDWVQSIFFFSGLCLCSVSSLLTKADDYLCFVCKKNHWLYLREMLRTFRRKWYYYVIALPLEWLIGIFPNSRNTQ